MVNKNIIIITVSLIFFVHFTSLSFAQSIDLGRESLRGLKGVRVEIIYVDPVLKNAEYSLTTTQLKSHIELLLRKTGIYVLKEEELLETPGYPILGITIRAVPMPKKVRFMYPFSIQLVLQQEVILTRKPNSKPINAITWADSTLGVVGERKLREILNFLDLRLEYFMNDYLSVNPK